MIEILWNYNKTMFVSILLERSTFYFDVSFKYPFCLSLAFSCIIIDNSGFLVMHPHFIETESLKGQNHIAYLVSRCTLIITLSPLTCLNIQNGCLFRYSLKNPVRNPKNDWYMINYTNTIFLKKNCTHLLNLSLMIKLFLNLYICISGNKCIFILSHCIKNIPTVSNINNYLF